MINGLTVLTIAMYCFDFIAWGSRRHGVFGLEGTRYIPYFNTRPQENCALEPPLCLAETLDA